MKPAEVTDVRLVELPRHTADNGELVVIEEGHALPFVARRMFTVRAPEQAIRGRHAHKQCSQFLICVHGHIDVLCDDGKNTARFVLNNGSTGLLIPAGVWATETYIENDSVLSVLCDRRYEQDDYLRDYEQFLQWRARNA
jgi:dTDP-4-dehydrorhamnose 3,5-epimerase-like enzyme